MGVSKTTVNNWAKGRSLPDGERAIPLAQWMGGSLDWLYLGRGEGGGPLDVTRPHEVPILLAALRIIRGSSRTQQEALMRVLTPHIGVDGPQDTR